MADPLPDAVEPRLPNDQERLYALLRMIYGEDLSAKALEALARRVRRGIKGLVDVKVKDDLL